MFYDLSKYVKSFSVGIQKKKHERKLVKETFYNRGFHSDNFHEYRYTHSYIYSLHRHNVTYLYKYYARHFQTIIASILLKASTFYIFMNCTKLNWNISKESE